MSRKDKAKAKKKPRNKKPGSTSVHREAAVGGVKTIRVSVGGAESVRPSDKPSQLPEILPEEGIGKYEMGTLLAEGGMGAVYQAHDKHCRRTVAMKVLADRQCRSPEDLTRFVEEAQITSQLEHPNIVPVHELGKDSNGCPYYTMKYVRGLTLTDVLEDIRGGKQEVITQYPLARLLTIFQKACDAVAFAHSRNVIHRDLKPDNILLGDFGEVLVMDWGLAKWVGAPKPAEESVEKKTHRLEVQMAESVDSLRSKKLGSGLRTIGGQVVGTPAFMSPEQAASGKLDVRSDIYTLGAILYSILTLRPPVMGDNLQEVLQKIKDGKVIPIQLYKEGVDSPTGHRKVSLPHCPGRQIPVALIEVVLKAMTRNPADRYQSVKDFQQDIEAYQDGLIWNLIIDEDFSEPNITTRWAVYGGKYELVNGELRLYGGEPQFLLLRHPLPGDVRIEFECHQESIYLNDIACFLSAVPARNLKETPPSGYEFKFGAYSNSVNVLARSDIKLWSKTEAPLVRGKKYVVRAERVGSQLRMTVNGEEIFKVTDPDPLSGPDRTAVGVLGWMADTRYSRIRVYSLGTPWKADALDTAERHLHKGHYVTAMDLFKEVIDSLPDPERRERAMKGYEVARNRQAALQSLPSMREKLEEEWPGIVVDLRMDNDGLTLDISNRGIRDLSPLRGLPLTTVYCSDNRIASLEPLRGMQLVTLNCANNVLNSLEPLQGMPLQTLICENCLIESLDPLKGMRLSMLNCGGNLLQNGLEPLRGIPLTWMSCWSSGIDSLEPLRGMPLNSLYCDGNRITSLEPLKGMPLGTLHCAGNRIESLEPLREMRLTTLHCADNLLRDLEPLHNVPLTIFSCHGNMIESLKPLKLLPLGSLTCGMNPLTTLEPLVVNPPYNFFFDSPTIPDDEMKRVIALWAGNPNHAHHARNVKILLAMRRHDIDALRTVADEFNGHRYLFIPSFMTWAEAKAFCEKLGGHLVTITSKEENNFVTSLIPGGSWFWLGLQTTSEGHQWVTGEKFSFSSFVDLLREQRLGGKIFCGGTWTSEVYDSVRNSFMIEWES